MDDEYARFIQVKIDNQSCKNATVIQACASLDPKYQPRITFVVLQKRHHTRLFPNDPNFADKSDNIPPEIWHPTIRFLSLQPRWNKGIEGKCQCEAAAYIEREVYEGSVGEKKLRTSADESRMVTKISVYNAWRHEFKIEYDNDAETLLADMEFKESDTESERELKLRVLRIYGKR